jgi:hypothetical protein
MSDIFQEVDEEVRRDKAAQFWKKYQYLIFAGVAVIVLATAGYRFYENRMLAAEQAAGAAYEQALALERAGKDVDAEAAFARLAADAPRGYQTLARLAAAGVRAKSDRDGALEAYDALAADSSVGPLFRDAARLRAALLRLDAGQADAAKPALEALAGLGAPYRNTARLALGVIALDAADYQGAGKWLDLVVADDGAPEVEKKSAQSLLGLVAANRPAAK